MPENSPVLDWIAVVIPITSPCISSSGPPELPGFIAASVWITFGIENEPPLGGVNNLPVWLIIPDVMEPVSPKGLPIAATSSPIRSLDESPSCRGWKTSGLASTLTIARSANGSVPITLAE